MVSIYFMCVNEKVNICLFCKKERKPVGQQYHLGNNRQPPALNICIVIMSVIECTPTLNLAASQNSDIQIIVPQERAYN